MKSSITNTTNKIAQHTTTQHNKLHSKQQTKQQPRRSRQAISGMIVTIILIGIVVSIGGILSVTVTDVVSTGLVLETVEIKRLVIQNTQSSSFVSAMIKNNGNTDLEGAHITIQKDNGKCIGTPAKDDATCAIPKNTQI